MMIAGTEHRRQGCSLQDGKQWGYYVESQNPTDYRYWSIPFTSHYITMATKTYYEPKEEAVPWLVGIDMQKFICGYGANFIGSSYVSCVGIGCQLQWGENVGGGGQTVSLPISFEVAFTAVVSADSSWCNASCHITTTTITTMNYQSNRPDIAQAGPVQWLALGCQLQWGINSAGNDGSEGESGWYAFPVNFNSACFALFCGLRNTDTNKPTNYDSEVQPRNWTTTKFNVYKQNYGGNPWFGSFIWFAIGRQPASYKL